MTHSTSPHKHKHGFSLVELLVVMAIIAILTGIVVGVSGSVQLKAGVAKARAEIADLMNELEVYKSDEGHYPSNWSQFGTWYTQKYPGTLYKLTEGSASAPLDPWGNGYQYGSVSDFTYLIGSWGPDGLAGSKGIGTTLGQGDDITNRNGAL